MSNSEKSEYLLGSADDEVERLWRQHQAWLPQGEEILAETEFSVGMHLLDLGCGPGFTSRRLAELVGSTGSVTGVDRSARFEHIFSAMASELEPSSESRSGRLQFIRADVDRLEEKLKGRRFDGAFARWLFCFLPDPVGVAREVRNHLRPGAQLVIHDYHQYLSVGFLPQDPALKRGFEAVHASFEASGGNLDVGDTLAKELEKAGYRVESTRHFQIAAKPGEDHWRWFEDFYATYFSSLVTGGFLTATELESFDQALACKREDPKAVFNTPPVLGIVARAE